MFSNIFTYTILVPIVAAIACFIIRVDKVRSTIVFLTGLVLMVSSVMLISQVPFSIEPEALTGLNISGFVQIADYLLLLFMLFIGIKRKNILISLLSVAQIALLTYFEFFVLKGIHSTPVLFCDNLSIIMVLIISFAGSLICIYAIPYMKNHEKHLKLKKSKQPVFFFLLLIFLGAMNGLVLCNDLLFFYFFFEITTICSFLLIGHDRNKESEKNSETALWMNSLGGLALLVGIVLIFKETGTLNIQDTVNFSGSVNKIIIPLGFICVAGFIKSAQMPFQKWLLGAMVAPTPTSALLHSSTMVKAGVYLVIRFAPAFEGTFLSTSVALCGGFTFLSAAALAVGQSNSKKVLAYSTISNLGLIFACAGINSKTAITAALLLIIFHAVSKALLFLCVGSIEQHIGSRDIEDMRGLFGEMPKTAIIISLGILTMILPPFGMLLGKWMAIESASGNLFIILMLALGSALTLVYWARWAGIIMGSDFSGEPKKEAPHVFVKLSLGAFLGASLILSFIAPLIYTNMIQTGITGSSNASYSVLGGVFSSNSGSFAVYPLSIIAFIVFAVAIVRSGVTKGEVNSTPYMSGIQGEKDGTYLGPMNKIFSVSQSNYYLTSFFGEKKISKVLSIVAGLLLLIMFGGVI